MKRLILLVGIFSMLSSCTNLTVRKENFELQGIDVSHYQKSIDWNIIAEQNVHFAFIKATEGESFRDSLFCKNWGAIKQAGIIRGAYHFFRPSVDAKIQAQNFINWVDMEDGDLAPVLDVEVLDHASAHELVKGVRTWLNKVEEKFLIKPIIYTNQNFFNKYLAGHFKEYPIWIARYTNWRYPAIQTEQNWAFWQYGNKGTLNGISGYVDFNVFNGDNNDLHRYRFRTRTASSVLTAPITKVNCVGP